MEFADTGLTTGVTRQRQCTEKGKSFIVHLGWKDCQTVGKRVQGHIKEIASLATTKENVDIVERNLIALHIIIEELTRYLTALLDDLQDKGDQLTVANDWYVERSMETSDFIEKTVWWISSAKEAIRQSLEVRSQASSKHTRPSHRSHASSRYSITSSRVKEKA